jgi:hypothetical protein
MPRIPNPKVPNEKVAQLWGQGLQAHSKNVFTIGNTIYSYGKHYPMAVKDPTKKVVYLNTEKYELPTGKVSRSTLKQLGEVRANIPMGFEVKEVSTPEIQKIAEKDEASTPNKPNIFSMSTKWVRTDAWRGYEQPVYAIAGVSDTGNWSDSPIPSDKSMEEIKKLQSHLASQGIKTKIAHAQSSNVFMMKHWLVPTIADFDKAKKISEAWLNEHKSDTDAIHGAD